MVNLVKCLFKVQLHEYDVLTRGDGSGAPALDETRLLLVNYIRNNRFQAIIQGFGNNLVSSGQNREIPLVVKIFQTITMLRGHLDDTVNSVGRKLPIKPKENDHFLKSSPTKSQ